MLNQKTELQKAMEKHKGKQIAKEQEREKQANLTPFQKALEQQAMKLEQVSALLRNEIQEWLAYCKAAAFLFYYCDHILGYMIGFLLKLRSLVTLVRLVSLIYGRETFVPRGAL